MFGFNKTFEVVEVHEDNGVRITHFLHGRKKDVNKDIEAFKAMGREYKMFKDGMVVWC